ncbi:MAG: hypothetical protein ACTS27_11080 [Phycisphaerales bacterium]
MTREPSQPDQRPHRRTRLAVAGAGGAGGATLAFLLLVLCGVSGAAVLDPALGAWNSVIASRLDAPRTPRTLAADTRLAGVALSARVLRVPGVRDAASIESRGHAAFTSTEVVRAAVSAGLLDLPPPARA